MSGSAFPAPVATAGGWRHVAVVFGVTKALQAAALLLGAAAFFVPAQRWNYLVFSDHDVGLLAALVNWDGQHYLRLAMQGYPWPPDASTAFYPLFPWLISLFMLPGLHPIAAGLLVVMLCSALALWLLQRLLPADEASPSSLWLLMCFPTAFYMSVVYSEALFLAAFFGLLLALREPGRARWALVCAAALPLTRGQGLWLLVPLTVAWLALLWPAAARAAPHRRSLAYATAGYALGALAYAGFLTWRYGDPRVIFYVQQELFVFKIAPGNFFDLGRFVEYLLRPSQHFFDPNNAGFDKLMMLVSLLAMAVGMRRTREPFLLAAWATFAVFPALMGEGGSYGRHALLPWACFVVAAGPSLPRWAKWTLLVAGFTSQVLLAPLFGGNHWVG
jgi:hypothetical protein